MDWLAKALWPPLEPSLAHRPAASVGPPKSWDVLEPRRQVPAARRPPARPSSGP